MDGSVPVTAQEADEVLLPRSMTDRAYTIRMLETANWTAAGVQTRDVCLVDRGEGSLVGGEREGIIASPANHRGPS